MSRLIASSSCGFTLMIFLNSPSVMSKPCIGVESGQSCLTIAMNIEQINSVSIISIMVLSAVVITASTS